MAYKIEFRVGSQTYVAAVEKVAAAENRASHYLVFLEDDRLPCRVWPSGIVSRDGRAPIGRSDVLLCRTAVELAKEFLEEVVE